MQTFEAEIAIVGAGIAGIATAYYLSTKHGKRDLVLLDRGPPMGFTTAQSGENYRDWWPHPAMAAFTGRSIELMERIARDSANVIHMTRRGYALATRREPSDDLAGELLAGYGTETRGVVRRWRGHEAGAYEAPDLGSWQGAPCGVDVITDRNLIGRHFPQFDPAVATVVHVRRAGDVSAQQLGQYMLDSVKERGGRLRHGALEAIDQGATFDLTVTGEGQASWIRCATVVNAAGPFLNAVAQMIDVALPVCNVLQQKIAFEDRAGAVPRTAPFSVDLDPQTLDWSDEERNLLAESAETAWLAERFPGGIHCRPEGGPQGAWVKLGWAYNTKPCDPDWAPPLDPAFPEIVLRGASALQPALKAYAGRPPGRFSHYGGYYTMTRENWPIIGPMGGAGAFVVGALSGFGTMAACAAGELCADWIAGGALPEYAQDLSLARYQDDRLIATLKAMADRGIL